MLKLSHPVLKSGDTCVHEEFMLRVISDFEARVSINQIKEAVESSMLNTQAQRVREYLAQHKDAMSPLCMRLLCQKLWCDVPLTPNKKSSFPSRRKLTVLVAQYFAVFIKPEYENNMSQLCRFLCKGISIDETFKSAAKVSVLMENSTHAETQPDRYVSATYALHTAVSLQTRLVCGQRFMPAKSGSQKAVLLRHILQQQEAAPNAEILSFCATDCPKSDQGMVHDLCWEMRGSDIPPADMGDDHWHWPRSECCGQAGARCSHLVRHP